MGSVYSRHSSLEQKFYGYTQEWFFILLLFYCCDLTILFIKQDILILEESNLPSNDRTYTSVPWRTSFLCGNLLNILVKIGEEQHRASILIASYNRKRQSFVGSLNIKGAAASINDWV